LHRSATVLADVAAVAKFVIGPFPVRIGIGSCTEAIIARIMSRDFSTECLAAFADGAEDTAQERHDCEDDSDPAGSLCDSLSE
jgi:hypothetical protein